MTCDPEPYCPDCECYGHTPEAHESADEAAATWARHALGGARTVARWATSPGAVAVLTRASEELLTLWAAQTRLLLRREGRIAQ